MSTSTLDAGACAAFLIVAFALAGCAQAAWLASPLSSPLAWPIDGGVLLRGRRLLGPNKTVRGFVVMVPATGLGFVAVAVLAPEIGRWRLSLDAYAALGMLAGFGFMAAELPNSFVKRQLDIPPGAAASGPIARPMFFVIDHLDSACGVLTALSLVVPVPILTSVYVLSVGAAVHVAFSRLIFEMGGKARAA